MPIGPRPAPGSALGDLISLNGIVFAVIVGGLLVRRWLAASPPARRVHEPEEPGAVHRRLLRLPLVEFGEDVVG